MPRRAGLHSIGIGGVNAHVILQEHIEQISNKKYVEPVRADQNYQLFVVSAKSKLALKAYLQKWTRYLSSDADKLPTLAELAYSSQVSRDAMPYRIALVVNSIEDLRQLMESNIEAVDDLQSITKLADEYILDNTARDKSNLTPVASAWARGVHIDWKKLAGPVVPGVVRIPDYPFQNKSIWFLEKPMIDTFDKLFAETFATPVSSD